MQRLAIVGFLVIAACTGAQELATTVTSTAPISEPTTPEPAVTTTGSSVPAETNTTTTLAPLAGFGYQEIARFEFPIQLVARPGDDISCVATKSLFASGLRNRWRFWIDEGNIYVADVGQNAFEEISVTAVEPGLNFG
jgi:hypothetical protein